MTAARVLVVCVGNICRSPLAERVMRMRFTELSRGRETSPFHVSSAGVMAVVGAPMELHAAEELRRLGGDPSDFAATQLTGGMLEQADLVLTATRQLRSRVLEDAPRALRYTFTIREFAAISTMHEFDRGGPTDKVEFMTNAFSLRSSARVVDYDVQDPMGQGSSFHRDVADLLDANCSTIAHALARRSIVISEPVA